MKKMISKVLANRGYKIVRHDKSKALKSTRSDKLELFETKTGNYYLPSDAHQDVVANAIKNDKIFEKDVVDLAKKYIKNGTTVLDVGSNFGQMTVLFAGMAGENGKVYCFDADDFVYDILVKNIAANGLENRVFPNFGAVHDKHGEELIFPVQDFERFGAYGSYGIDYNATKGRVVKSLTIDSMNIETSISFMKIDIQGGDLQAMKGAVKTIEKNQMPILFEYEYHFEDEYGYCFQDYVDFVASINYKFHKVVNGHNFLIIPK